MCEDLQDLGMIRKSFFDIAMHHTIIARKLRLKTAFYPIADDELSTIKNDGRP